MNPTLVRTPWLGPFPHPGHIPTLKLKRQLDGIVRWSFAVAAWNWPRPSDGRIFERRVFAHLLFCSFSLSFTFSAHFDGELTAKHDSQSLVLL
jgi:hypothetical protein